MGQWWAGPGTWKRPYILNLELAVAPVLKAEGAVILDLKLEGGVVLGRGRAVVIGVLKQVK